MKTLLILILVFICGCSPYVPYIRGGDCIDRAVEIRRSLRDQGYEAEIVLGTMGKNTGHAWIEYKDKTGNWKRINNY